MKMPCNAWKGGWFGFSLVGVVAVLALTITGCPPGVSMPSDGSGGGGSGTSGSTNAQIIVPSNFGLSEADSSISIQYTVPDTATDVRAFAVQVENDGVDASTIGDPKLLVAGLPAGGGQAFTFDPSDVGVGFYRLRITFVFNGVEEVTESVSAIEVQGAPVPSFVRPTVTQLKVVQGDDVAISFDAGDPQDEVEWRLFYLRDSDPRDAIPSALGVEMIIGTGNAGVFNWSTASVPPGVYELGVSATDSGSTVAGTASSGEVDRIVTIPNATVTTPLVEIISPDEVQVPFVQITAPGKNNVRVFQDQDFTIKWNATVFGEGVTGTVEVFYDVDKNVDNGFVSIKKDLSEAVSSVVFPANVAEGTYFIGATIRDGVNPPQTDYSEGTIEVVRGVFLQVTSPDASLPVPPGTQVNIAWTTNAPVNAGSVKVVYQTVFRTGAVDLPFGAEQEILRTSDLTTRSSSFTSNESGLFQVSVRMTLVDGTVVKADAPQLVQFSTLPGIIYLGSLAEACTNDPQNSSLPRCAGAIFGGVNFEDNAGSSLTTAGDLNGDGIDEFVIASRYGKPFFLNPQGIGPGEAYIVYGRSSTNRLRGEFNLNSIGSSRLTGVTLPGVRPSATCQGSGDQCETDLDCPNDENCLTPVDTDGLADVTLLPDVDGDGAGELSFGFPRTNSQRQFPMAAAGQFLAGGVVFLSSNNSILRNPDLGLSIIGLSDVGRSFVVSTCVGGNNTVTQCQEDADCGNNGVCTAMPAQASILLDDGTWVAVTDDSALPFIFEDRLGFNGDMCIPGSDGVFDTIVGPSIGFRDKLAIPAWEQLGFELITAGERPLECLTQFDIANCQGSLNSGPFSESNSGSGFFPSGAVPMEPFGARILGRGDGDFFGTSIAVSKPAEGQSVSDLIITSPLQAARVGLPSNGGVAHIFAHRNLWNSPGGNPPTPHQYVIGLVGDCGGGRAGGLDGSSAVGDTSDQIENVLGIQDFNDDFRNDFAVGAPNANGGGGRMYIAFRREGLEGEFRLDKLALSPDLPDRLDGFLLRSDSAAELGFSLAAGFDFNGDGIEDVAVGAPGANHDIGEVVIVFGQQGIVSPAQGYEVEEYLSMIRNVGGRPVAARITGQTLGGVAGKFGFNIANAGDVDGDGKDDLLVSAPEASPFFDPNPSDDVDELTEPGTDLNRDGIRDKWCRLGANDDRICVTGADCPDGFCEDRDFESAGLVYVIFGGNPLGSLGRCSSSGKYCTRLEGDVPRGDCDQGETCDFTNITIDVDELGSSRLRGFIIVGRRGGDRLGGGDAGDVANGGIGSKSPSEVGRPSRGRSRGLASAGDVDGDGRDDMLIGSILADPRRDPTTDVGVTNGGEVYLIYGSNAPAAGGR